jgi:hypothetical protein
MIIAVRINELGAAILAARAGLRGLALSGQYVAHPSGAAQSQQNHHVTGVRPYNDKSGFPDKGE